MAERPKAVPASDRLHQSSCFKPWKPRTGKKVRSLSAKVAPQKEKVLQKPDTRQHALQKIHQELRSEVQELKRLLAEKEAELDRLKDEIRYKDQRLASKDLEMETYRKISEERIFKLEARVKELEAKHRATLGRSR